MAKRPQTAENKEDQKRTHKHAPKKQDQSTEAGILARLPGDLLSLPGDGSIQAAHLRDPRLQTAQRQAIAKQLGKIGGNRYLQRILAHQPPKGSEPMANNVVSRKARVEKFGSYWEKGPLVDQQDLDSRGRNANLQIKVAAIFANTDGFNPMDAEYRQFVKDKWEITDPPHRKGVIAQSDWHDDGYSRADDVGQGQDKALLRTQDYPGLHHSTERQDGLLATDVLEATFSAKQQVIDTSNNDEVIAEIDEHEATIQGLHPRAYAGVPARLGTR